MRISMKGRILDIYRGKELDYCTMNDTVQGGQLKLGLSKNLNLQIDQAIEVNAEVKPSAGKDGLYLKVISLIGKDEK